MSVAYKLLRVKKSSPGQLFPLFVLSDEALPIGVWLTAKEGPRTENGKVRSRLGPLAFRPGFHLSELPLATHIGVVGDGDGLYMHPDTVWCRCEYTDSVDYQEEADKNGWNGKAIVRQKAFLDHIPVDGFYHYKTLPQMFGDWIIAGGMEIEKVLADDEVAEILKLYDLTPQPRQEPMDLSFYGFDI